MNFRTVAIASFPRSGNTWLRHLIHAATGLGSKYALNPETGPVHEAAAITKIEDQNSPLIKTHARDVHGYEAAIHLVRNPVMAISSYVDYCQDFGVPMTISQSEFVEVEANGWKTHAERWRMAHQCGIIVGYFPLRYEDLCDDTYGKLWQICRTFLGLEVSNEAIAEAEYACSLKNLRAKGKLEFFRYGNGRKPTNLTAAQIETILRVCGGEMIRWNYPL